MHTFSSSNVVLVGFGYWGKVLCSILLRNNISISAIFSRDPIKVSDEFYLKYNSSAGSIPSILQHSQLSSYLKSKSNSTIFLILACGPIYHFDIIDAVISAKSCNKINIWLEKPLFVDKRQELRFEEMQEKSKKLIVEFYVDYPYVANNISEGIGIKDLKLEANNSSMITVSIYSKHFHWRGFDIVYDYMPHFYSIFKSILGLDPFELVTASIISEPSNSTEPCRKIIFKLASGRKVIFDFGKSLRESSITMLLDNCYNPLSSLRLMTYSLKDLFGNNPIDKNIKLFIAGNIDSSSASLQHALDHSLIYQLSNRIIDCS